MHDMPLSFSESNDRTPDGVIPGLPGEHRKKGPLDGLRILLLEDEVFIAVDVQFVLEDAGAIVTYARNLREASAVLDAPYDAAVLDVTLGQGNTCRPVAEALRLKGVPFLIHSGDLDRQGEVIRALNAPVVPKPASAEDVVNALIATLGRASAH